jgi:DNA polymerase-3 subunit epsilon
MFAVIDIETTGGNASRDRITEIAIILHDGLKEEGRFSSLVNPEIRIPPYITDITGITDAMVASAPRFFEIAKQIVQLTEGRIFVAHNVGFDYGFIREEFRRLAFDYQREKLCTVRTSRMLIPGHPTYSLGKLCHALGIPLRDRHRALGDAEATALLLELLVQKEPNLGGGKTKRDPYASIPPGIPRKVLTALPEDPGIYFLHDHEGKVLLSNMSPNIRQDVLKVLKEGKKEMGQLRNEVSDITWELTGSELLAALRMITGPKEKPKATRNKAAVYAYHDQRNYLRIVVGAMVKGRECAAEFGTEADAKAAMEARMRKHSLCAALLGFEPAGKACSRFPAGGCEGACLGLESPEMYNARVEEALQGLGLPYARFLLVSNGRDHSEVSVLSIENGGCTGMGFLDASFGWDNPAEVAGLLQPFPHPNEGGAVVRQYLPKLKIQQFHPY